MLCRFRARAALLVRNQCSGDAMEQDRPPRTLDEEGIPDLEGPLPEKAATGDPQEGTPPPSDRPAAADYGVTAEEQSRPEPLDRRLAREEPDTLAREEPGTVLVGPEDEGLGLPDDEREM